jgi:phosphatidylserine/phosphatidylglycerophosphate/cardiolipin synthase-like enzyme
MRELAAALNDLKLDSDLVRHEIATHAHVTTGSLHSKMLVVDGKTAVLTGSGAVVVDECQN